MRYHWGLGTGHLPTGPRPLLKAESCISDEPSEARNTELEDQHANLERDEDSAHLLDAHNAIDSSELGLDDVGADSGSGVDDRSEKEVSEEDFVGM